MQTLTVHAYDWIERRINKKVTEIHCWVIDRNSDSYLLRFNNFYPFCYIELPLMINGSLYQWNQESIDIIIDTLSDYNIVNYKLVYMKKLYYYQCNKEYPMLCLYFKTSYDLHRCNSLLKEPIEIPNLGFIKFNTYETSIPTINKLLTIKNLKCSQWFNVSASKVDPKLCISISQKEYFADWNTINPIPLEESKYWLTQPKILAFDIECYSDNHRAVPDKYNALHVVYMISCIYQRYKDPKSRKRYGIIIGECNNIPSERLDNCEIIKVKTEYELIQAFADIVNKTDPEVLIGYNIFGFDYVYLDARIKRLLKEWPEMGRIKMKTTDLVSKSWKSNAYGHQNINILQMDGRISIDLFTIITRDFKLNKYDLDTVSKKFIGKGKHDIKPKEMFAIYEQMKKVINEYNYIIEQETKDSKIINNKKSVLEMLEYVKAQTTRVMEYCIQDSELVIELMEKLNIWLGLVEMSNIVGVKIVELFTRGQQIRCLYQIYDLASKMKFVLNQREIKTVSNFTGGFVYEPVPGLYDNVICLDFASLYPSIIMAYNICYTTLIPPELENLIPDEDCNIIEFDQVEGESIKHYRFKFYKKQEGLLPYLVRQLVSERKSVNKQIAQLKDEIKNLESNASEMDKLQLKEKIEDNKILITVLDKRQWALKITSNSFFGFLGVYNGRMPLIEGAMCITAKGRELINEVRKYIEQKYQGTQIYGDTDSVMVKLPQIKESKDCYYWGIKLSQDINGIKPGDKDCDGIVVSEGRKGLFPPPLSIEFEKAMRLLCLKKKKYAAYLISKDGTFKTEEAIDSNGNPIRRLMLLTKGIILARRDNCKFICDVYSKILEIVMNRGGVLKALEILINSIEELINNKVPYKDLAIIRVLGSNYKSETSYMRIFANELKKIGKIVSPNDRLEYLIVKGPENALLGYRMRLLEQYIEDPSEQIDYYYYIENLLLNPVEQLFEIGFKDEINQLEKITFLPPGKKKFLTLRNPVKMIIEMIRSNHSLETLKNKIINELKQKKIIKLNIIK